MAIKKERLPIIISIGIWGVAIILLGAALAIYFKKQSEKQEQIDYENWLVDLASETEKLNSTLEESAKSDPNFNYSTSTTQSKYTEVLGKYFYDNNEKNGINSLANALASGAGIIIERKVEPKDFVFNTANELETVKQNILQKYNLNLTVKNGMNSNILNYHLDNGEVVVIFAKGEYPYSENGRAILVFGGYLVDALYLTFSPEKDHDPYDESKTHLFPKTTLFETIQSNEKFYILKSLNEN